MRPVILERATKWFPSRAFELWSETRRMSKKRGGVAVATLSTFCEIRRSRSPKIECAAGNPFCYVLLIVMLVGTTSLAACGGKGEMFEGDTPQTIGATPETPPEDGATTTPPLSEDIFGQEIAQGDSKIEAEKIRSEDPKDQAGFTGQVYEGGRVRVSIETPHAYPIGDQTQPVVWSQTITHEKAIGIRVFFADFDVEDDENPGLFQNDYVAILNKEAQVVARYTGKSQGFWSDYVIGDSITIELHSDDAASAYGFKIIHYEFYYDKVFLEDQPKPSTPLEPLEEAIYLTNDLIDMQNFLPDDPVYQRGQAVARLAIVIDNVARLCTGFLFAPDRLMTNNHCIATQPECDGTRAYFNFESYADGTFGPYAKAGCSALLETDWIFDYSVLRLNASPGDQFGTLKLSAKAANRDDALVIVQHPLGGPKQVSLSDCRVSDAIVDGNGVDTDLGHQCDTQGGSSGSPVMDRNTFDVVGLHHWGGASTTDPNSQNQAVRMSRILGVCQNCDVSTNVPPTNEDTILVPIVDRDGHFLGFIEI